MAIKFNRSQTFATNGTVTAAGLHNLIDGTDIYQALITDQTAMTSVGSLDKLLIADSDLTASDAPRSVTVNELFEDALTLSTYTNVQATNSFYTNATGNYTRSTGATITNGTITNGTITNGTIASGTIPTLTAGTTTSTAANITNGTVQTLTASTANISQGSAILTQGTIATLNSTTGTIATLNSTTGTITTGTIPTLVATTLVTIGTGTAVAPAIVSAGGTNTGIFFPAAETLAATTNGTERLRIASSGQIGIGGANYGTSGQALVSNGISSAPSWQTISAITIGTAVTSTSGTAIDFTAIPSWAQRVTLILLSVSTNNVSIVTVRLGTSGGFETSGYVGVSSQVLDAATGNAAAFTTGFEVRSSNASSVRSGSMTFYKIDGNQWVASGVFGQTGISTTAQTGGYINLPSALTQLRVTTVNGTDAFDSGKINIMYEG